MNITNAGAGRSSWSDQIRSGSPSLVNISKLNQVSDVGCIPQFFVKMSRPFDAEIHLLLKLKLLSVGNLYGIGCA